MTDPRRVAGWVTVCSGGILLIAIAATAFGGATGGRSPWLMGPGMMGNGSISPGMMGNGSIGPGMMGFGLSGPAATAIPGAPEARLQALNFSFSPSEIRVHSGTDANLTVSNPPSTGVVHDFTVPALGIHIVVNPGESRTVGLHGLVAGRYDGFCSVPGHAQLGMRATIVVE